MAKLWRGVYKTLEIVGKMLPFPVFLKRELAAFVNFIEELQAHYHKTLTVQNLTEEDSKDQHSPNNYWDTDTIPQSYTV